MIKKIGIPIVAAVVIFAIAVTIDFDEPVTYDNLPQNTYTITPVTTPIKITTQTIEPSSIQVDSETKTAEKTIIDKNSYSGAGFVFPFLQKSFGISASTTTLNVEDWDLGHENVNAAPIWKDETEGSFDGNIYFSSRSSTVNEVYSLNPTTNLLTTWTNSGNGWTDNVYGNSAGQIFFTTGIFGTSEAIHRLNPLTDQITVWDIDSVLHEANPHGLVFDDDDIAYFVTGNGPSRFYSLDPGTNELKIWNVDSICPFSGFALTGLDIDSAGKLYANQLEVVEICTLDPATNQVTLYDTGLDFNRTWVPSLDPRPENPGHLYLGANSDTDRKIMRIDTVNNETTVWTLTGLYNLQFVDVDSNGLVWGPTFRNSAGALETGLVMLNPDTNSVTEWAFGYDASAGGGGYLTAVENGDIWMHIWRTDSGTNNHLLRFYE